MGTNYYCKTKKTRVVTCNCGFDHVIPETLHIGKNSGGWCFRLHGINNNGRHLTNADEWENFLKNDVREIYNEYNDPITLAEMLRIIRKPASKLSKSEYTRLAEYVEEENSKSLYKMKLVGGLLTGINETLPDEHKNAFYVVDYGDFC